MVTPFFFASRRDEFEDSGRSESASNWFPVSWLIVLSCFGIGDLGVGDASRRFFSCMLHSCQRCYPEQLHPFIRTFWFSTQTLLNARRLIRALLLCMKHRRPVKPLVRHSSLKLGSRIVILLKSPTVSSRGLYCPQTFTVPALESEDLVLDIHSISALRCVSGCGFNVCAFFCFLRTRILFLEIEAFLQQRKPLPKRECFEKNFWKDCWVRPSCPTHPQPGGISKYLRRIAYHIKVRKSMHDELFFLKKKSNRIGCNLHTSLSSLHCIQLRTLRQSDRLRS